MRTFEARKQGMRGLRLEVDCEHPQPERHFSEIAGLIQRSSLPQPVKDNAVEAFQRLAEAEGRIHGVSPDHVHFHEVGAVDSIVDMVGAMLACDHLGVQRCVSARPSLWDTGPSVAGTASFPCPLRPRWNCSKAYRYTACPWKAKR